MENIIATLKLADISVLAAVMSLLGAIVYSLVQFWTKRH